MVSIDLEPFYRFHQNVVSDIVSAKKRYLADQIDWSENAIMVVGDRGVGKTTMLVQRARLTYRDIDEWLYIAGDYFELAETKLYSTVDSYFAQKAGKCIILDEVHKYPNWKTELKNILDAFQSKKIFISGSSSIHLLEGTDSRRSSIKDSSTDLQRRRTLYLLKHLSFREYLDFKLDLQLPSVGLSEMIENASSIALSAITLLKGKDMTVLRAFEDYLLQGCYPWFLSAPNSYGKRLEGTINQVIESDIALSMEINAEGVQKIKKLFSLIASSKPFSPNINSLSRELGSTRDTIYKYISYMEKSGLIRILHDEISKASQILTRPDKICIANPNLLQIPHDIRMHSEYRGSMRESFFVSNFSTQDITSTKKGDFCVGHYTFEIGGPNKTASQIEGIPNSFVVRDGQEIPSNKSLPLWMFGFLY